MIGLGPGARSYTQTLHYSTEYAVGQTSVKKIIEDFNCRDTASYASADLGVELNIHERKLRYVIKSLLRAEGVSLAAYRLRFGKAITADLPQLQELFELGLIGDSFGYLRLNEEGLAWSDTIGPWLYSDAVNQKMDAYELA
jgi:oxygen-independent coproporphyrinogen-3 oxidase